MPLSGPTLFRALRTFLGHQERAGRTCRVIGGGQPEETLSAEEARFIPGVKLVESDRLEVRPTGFRSPQDSATSGFRFFLDGVQYSHLIAYVDNVPLVHHLSAAAILRRDPETRELHLWRWTGIRECVLAPAACVDVDGLAGMGVPVEDTTDETPDPQQETMALRALAHSKSQRLRRHAEARLVQEWMDSGEEGWLMVDGSLMLLPGVRPEGRVAGVVKSLQAQYFDGEVQRDILSLPEGHRTTAFQLPRGSKVEDEPPDARRAFSWYVRIRAAHHREAEFGLLRVEIPPDWSILARADEISRWLIAERAPLSTPDPRWANLLYPVHACELYLRSALPQRRRVPLYLR